MNLFLNFVKLEEHNNVTLLDPNFFDSPKFTKEEFDKKINIKVLQEHEQLKLDKFLEESIKYYPILLRHVVTSHKNKNRYQKLENFNKRQDEHFLRLLEEKRFLDAAVIYTTKEITRLPKEEIEKTFTSKIIANNVFKIYSSLAQLATKEALFIDLKNVLLINFSNIIPIDNHISNIAKFLTEEIILRLNEPEEYVYTDDYLMAVEEIEKMKFEKIKTVHSTIIQLKVDKKKTDNEVLDFLNTTWRC
jgi:hypothetical protein